MNRIISFDQPVVKSDGSNQLIEAGDTLTVVLITSDKSFDTKDLAVVRVLSDGRDIVYDVEASAGVRPEDIDRVHSSHVFQCSSS